MDHTDYLDWAEKFVFDVIVDPKPFREKVMELFDKMVEIENETLSRAME